MSMGPSVFALGQILELCKRHPDVVQLLVSNPAALESLSKYPERAMAALTRLDTSQDIEETEVPYGLSSMGTPDMLARVRDLNVLEIPYRPCDTLHAHDAIYRTFSGQLNRVRVICTSENVPKTGYTTILFMRGPHQPYMPDCAGSLGVFLSATPRLEDWPPFENLFVSQTKDFGARRSHTHADDWLYAGRYELIDSRSLDVHEVALLPDETFEYWAVHINRRQGDYLARLRARVYLSVVDHMNNITEEDISRCISEHAEDVVIAAIRLTDIREALLDGTIRLQAFAMRPVGYDVGIPMLLEQTSKRIQAEQDAEDSGIEIISGPTRGTKRKTPPTYAESPRPGPGPSTSSSWRERGMGSCASRTPRPKRSATNVAINYRESDSECDFEPTRTAGPSSGASQVRRVVL